MIRAEGKEYQEKYVDFFKEVLNIGAGRSARLLNDLMKSHVELSVPSFVVLDLRELGLKRPECGFTTPAIAVDMGFTGGFSGISKLVFPRESAENLARALAGESEETDFDAVKEGIFLEVGNIVLNSVTGSFANFLKAPLEYSPPVLGKTFFSTRPGEERYAAGTMILAKTRFRILHQDIQGEIAIIFEQDSFERLFALIDSHYGTHKVDNLSDVQNESHLA